MIAQGLTTLDNDPQLIDDICQLVRERSVVCIVVGMPYSEDGGKGAKAQEVDRFIGRLKKRVDVEVDTWDESYSSVDAQRALIAGGMKRKKRRQKKRVDEMAARLLLQGYLDHSPTRITGAPRESGVGGV